MRCSALARPPPLGCDPPPGNLFVQSLADRDGQLPVGVGHGVVEDPGDPALLDREQVLSEVGERLREIDPAAGVIRMLELMGLAWDVVRVDPARRTAKELAARVA